MPLSNALRKDEAEYLSDQFDTLAVGTVEIACRALTKRYPARGGTSHAVIDGLNLSIEKGDFVCILGPSGCGKTTLLNMVAGFLTPSDGKLQVRGADVTGPGPDRGVVFQDYSLFPWLNVAGNVDFGLRMCGIPRVERKRMVRAYLELVGLQAQATRYPFELSGGMKQRVAIARALATDPALLLMDEPFAALDAMTRGALQAQLLEIQQQTKKTVLFVTHNIGEAIFLASRILVLSTDGGRLVEDIRLDDFPRPRKRNTPAFTALYERLAMAIGAEAGE